MISHTHPKIKIAMLGDYQQDYTKSMGGTYSYLRDLIKHLREYEDLDIHVITLSPDIFKDNVVKRNSVIFHYLHSPQLPRFFTTLTIDLYKALRETKKIAPDIIHVHSTQAYGIVANLLRKKYKYVMTVHGIVQEEKKTWSGPSGKVKGILYSMIERYNLKRVPTVFAVSKYVLQRVSSMCKGNIIVNPIGVEDNWFNIETREKKNRLLFVGGIEPRKGLEHLLKAIKLIKSIIPSVELHIVGKVRKQFYLKKLKDFVEKNHLEKNIKFLGFLNEIELKREYSECSVFVLPSQEESLGIVLLEAMAMGKPVVASDVGGISGIVDEGKTGFLVKYGDVNGIAKRIVTLLQLKELREKMGKIGMEKARNFTVEKNARRVHEVYRKIVGVNLGIDTTV